MLSCKMRNRIAVAICCLALATVVCAAESGHGSKGRLYLVGVGPGDPDLLTLRAAKVISEADLVICYPSIRDRLGKLLEGKELMCGQFWRLHHFIGLKPGDVPQDRRGEYEKITRERQQFIARIRKSLSQGQTVAILDNGDPMLYGPYVWCLSEFADADPEVIPGVSCFNAANALLQRSVAGGPHTKSVILTSADWPGTTDSMERLSELRCTMVLFTMQHEFGYFIERLSRSWPPDTPVAVVIQAGQKGRQRVVRGTLGDIQSKIDETTLPFEYLIYVGQFLSH